MRFSAHERREWPDSGKGRRGGNLREVLLCYTGGGEIRKSSQVYFLFFRRKFMPESCPCRLQTGKNMQEKRCGMTDRGRQSMKKRAGESAAFVRGQEKAPAWDVLQKRRGGVRMRSESRRGNGRTARHSQSVVRTGRRRRETEAALFLSVCGKAQGRVAGERDKTPLAGAPEGESVRPFGLLRIMSQKGGGGI